MDDREEIPIHRFDFSAWFKLWYTNYSNYVYDGIRFDLAKFFA